MQLQSKTGQMICDYYPVKNFNNIIDPTKVLRVLTFMGKTIHKTIISTERYVNDVYAVSYTHLTLPTILLV